MPELPEAEFGRKLAASVGQGRAIERVVVDDDPIVFEERSPKTVAAHFKGRTIVAAHRHGKYIWLELDRPPHPIVHFGMTGSFRIPKGEVLKLSSSPQDERPIWPPRFAKLHLFFGDGGELAFTNKRRLGRVLFRADPTQERPLMKLGPDPLLALPELPWFLEHLHRRRGPIKALLLNQQFLAGIGNWIADEVLYQSRIAPGRIAGTLSAQEVRALRTAVRKVIERAVAVDADKRAFPKTWLYHKRWGKKAQTTPDGPIQFDTIGGRTTAWVPARQK